MGKLWRYLKEHVREDFQPTYYIAIGVFLSLGLLLNFTLDLENSFIDSYSSNPIRMFWYFVLYGMAYYGTCFLTLTFKKRREIWRSSSFWVTTLFGLAVLSVNAGFPYSTQLLYALKLDVKLFSWALSVAQNILSLGLVIVPIGLFYYRTPRETEFYGLLPKTFDYKPYLILLALVIPIIVAASFQDGFVRYYPTYKHNDVAVAMEWPAWLPLVIYEFFYGLDFLNVELLFRGFMVIGLVHLLGKDAILPMVSTYCFLHFGKPLGEAVSSILGGYLLGVIALYTRSIWGGVILHIGIAWTMELIAYLQKAL